MNAPKLSLQQQSAVSSTSRHRIIVAGPGSGKTTTLVECIAKQLETTPSQRIAIISYTVAASHEIAERVEKRLGRKASFAYCGTLHGLMWRFLQHESGKWKSIIDEDAAIEMVASVAKEMKAHATLEEWKSIVSRESIILGHKMTGLTRQEIAAHEVFATLRRDGTTTFDGVLALGLDYMNRTSGNPQHLHPLHVFWDEFQDSSEVDILIRHQMRKESQVTVVGDPDQSIYGFRGAKSSLFSLLCKSAPADESVIVLSDNYRSGPEICAAANLLIAQNQNRIDKRTQAADRDRQSFVAWKAFASAPSEINGVVAACRNLPSPEARNQTAILARSNRQASEFRAALAAAGLTSQEQAPQRMQGVELVHVLLGIMANPRSDALVHRLVAMTNGRDRADKLRLDAQASMVPLWTRVWQDRPPSVTGAVPSWLERYEVPRETVFWVIEIIDKLQAHNQFVTVSELQVEIKTMLEQQQEQQPDPTGVWCGTVHAAKGREWDNVIVVGCEDDVWPGREDIEEMRRLMFVAMTRARTSLLLTSARTRPVYRGENVLPLPATERLPSRFIAEACIVKVD